MTFCRSACGGLAVVALGTMALAAAPPAAAYDMDCKLILCAAGGFPPGCADARAYMINRITSRPPKPPIGHCPMQGGGAVNVDADLERLRWRDQYSCPEGYNLYYRGGRNIGGDRDDRNERETAWCYNRVSCRLVREEDSIRRREVCTPIRAMAAVEDDYEITVRIPMPDGPDYTSPTYRFDVR